MLDFIEKGGDLRRLPHLNPSADKLFKPTPPGPAPGHPVDSSNISGFLQAQLEEVHNALPCGLTSRLYCTQYQDAPFEHGGSAATLWCLYVRLSL